MNRTLTIVLIIILSLIAIGIGAFAFLFSIGKISLNNNWYNIFNRESTTLVESKTYDKVEVIYVKSNTADVYIKHATDNKFSVEIYSDNEKSHSIDLSSNDLKVELEENNHFLFGKQPRIILYVPSEFENKIDIVNRTGDINSESYEKAKFKIDVTTGDTEIDKIDVADIKTTTGDIRINTINTIQAVCTTGDIRVDSINYSLDLKTTTGDIRIETADLKESGNIQTTTGDVRINTLNEVYVETESKTGDVRVNNKADRMSELSLHIKVTTGDIKVG